jgi:hypothetical protein
VCVTSYQGDYEAQVKSQENVIYSLKNELELLGTQNREKQQESVEITEQV